MKLITALLTCLLAANVGAATQPRAPVAPPARTFKTSFDCASAAAFVEKLVCHDPQLAQMDIELTRLYRLALTDDHSAPGPEKLIQDQQLWVDVRNQCASDPEPRPCTVQRYAERAYQLRQGSAIVRTKDPDSLTEGPLVFHCAGVDAPIAATFFNTLPGVLYLKWANTSRVLSQVQNDAGSSYLGKDYQGNYSFWQNGDGVMFQTPGSGAMSCTAEPLK